MFGRALFPTDFSDYANSVLACLPDLKAAGLREVVLLHVIRSSDVPLPDTVNRDSLERVRWGAEAHLNLARMALEGQGLRVRTRIEYGSPASRIVQVAEDELASLIVIGAQGWTAAAGAVDGQRDLRSAAPGHRARADREVRGRARAGAWSCAGGCAGRCSHACCTRPISRSARTRPSKSSSISRRPARRR